ncbi:MAG: hypothetical protein IAG13_07170 [Deltaproteobacteria bacterium]|nr:hypothetical protein [Nannocystaceae bacterium]
MGSVAHLSSSSANGSNVSDIQSALAVVIYTALIPMLTIAMAAGWLRGDAAPWSWALARPISRARWLGTTLLIDVATVLLCVTMASWMLGPLPHHWIGPWPGAGIRQLAYVTMLVLIYAAAAFAGARGGSVIAGALYAAGLGALVIVCNLLASIVEQFTRHSLFNDDSLSIMLALTRAAYFDGRGSLVPAVSSITTLLVITTFVAIVLTRTAVRSPARPSFRSLVGPLGTGAVLACAMNPLLVLAVVIAARL